MKHVGSMFQDLIFVNSSPVRLRIPRAVAFAIGQLPAMHLRSVKTCCVSVCSKKNNLKNKCFLDFFGGWCFQVVFCPKKMKLLITMG